MPKVPSDRPGSTVRDLSGTVSDGDDVLSAIHDVLDDGVQVYVPPGEYTGSHSDLDFSADDATIYGDPRGVSIQCDMDSNAEQGTATRLRIENIDIRGKKPLEQIKIDVDCSGGTLEWVNFNFPDGTESPTDSYVARCDSGHGKHLIKNCYIGPHGNSAFYYSQRDHENMPVVFEGCAFVRSAGPWRGGNGVLRDCIYVADGAVPDFKEPGGDPGGPGTPRMCKFEGGGKTVIENCDVYIGPNGDASGADGPCIDWGPDATDSNTIDVRNSRFANHIGREIFDTASGTEGAAAGSSLSNVSCTTQPYFSGPEISGQITNGDKPRTDVESRRWNPLSQGGSSGGGADPTKYGLPKSFEVVTGYQATAPKQSPGVWTPADGSVLGALTPGASATGSDGSSGQSHTLRIAASTDNPDKNCDVAVTTTGEIAFGDEAEPGTDEIAGGGDSYTARSVRMNPGAIDTYSFRGRITDVTVTEGYEVTLAVDGETVPFRDYFGNGDGSDGDGSDGSGGSNGNGNDGSNGDGNDGSDGSDGNGSGDGAAQPTKILVIDGTGDADEVAKYDFRISGTLERDEERSEVMGDGASWDTVRDFVGEQRGIGLVGNGRDAYRFTGRVTSLDIDGEAAARIIET